MVGGLMTRWHDELKDCLNGWIAEMTQRPVAARPEPYVPEWNTR